MKDIRKEKEMADIDNEDCLNVDFGVLERVIQAQRVVALEERRLDAAIEELLKSESETRSAGDIPRTSRVVVAIIQLCYESRAWKTLFDQILFLSQRPAQLKQAIVAMVHRADSYLDDTPDLDTRNKLIETLDNVSYDKGLRKLCREKAPNDSLRPCLTKLPLRESSPSELNVSSQQFQELAQAQAKTDKQNQGPVQEQFLATCVSRPNVPDPQQENKPRAVSPLIGKLPVKKGAKLVRKPLRPVRRRLFDAPSPADVEEFLSGLEQRDHKLLIDRYNFDPVKDEPLPGRFEWIPLTPQLQRQQLTRTTSFDSNIGGRRQELASTIVCECSHPPADR